MTYVFEEFELDPARRELRAEGEARSVQPQVFDLLLYLVENQDRVVPKQELLEALWPDTIVTESSIQRAVSLARSALGERGVALIQTFPRQGYRFVGDIKSRKKPSSRTQLRPRYAQSGGVHIAFTTLGEGETDIVIINGWILPMRAMFLRSDTRAAIEELTAIGRVILLDKRGTGLSDRVKERPAHEQRMDDLRAVLDACNSRQAVLIGTSEGGALAMLYAASHPERVRGLVLCGAFARMTSTPDYECGYALEEMEKLKGYIRGGWGKGASLRPIAPTELRDDDDFLDWAAFAEQEGASPGGALDFLEMNLQIDLRALLPAIRVPTIVLQARDDDMIHPGNGKYLAEHISGARFVEVPSSDHVFYFRTKHEISKAVRWVLAQEPPELEEDRFLSTVLAGDPNIDERIWLEQVKRFRGQSLPGARQAYFDGPIRALHCAAELARASGGSFGVHAGPVIRKGASIHGPALEVAEAIVRKASAGAVLASRVLVDLVPGSKLSFEDTDESVCSADREIPLLSMRIDS